MLTLYIRLITALDGRLRRDEDGDVLGFVAIGALVIAVVVAAVPQVQDLVKSVLDGIKSKIGGLT